jgi:hypothetical protein
MVLDYANKHNMLYYEVSAASGDNINDAFEAVA